MDIKEKINDCKYNLDQIVHFNPDPFYVNYFFKNFLISVNRFYDEIFEEANRDFGLFVSGKCTREKFESKSVSKNDSKALEFLSWFEQHYKEEHEKYYPSFIKKVSDYFEMYGELPKTTIKLIPNKVYKDDIPQEIKVDLTKEKLRSKESLLIEIKRQVPMYLEIINQKRRNNDEPKIPENQIIASTFLELQNYENMEIPYCCKVYLPVMNRFLEESRKEIRRLTVWEG